MMDGLHFFRTPLHLAAATGNDEITKFLLANKAKTNLCDNDGRTALMKVSCASLDPSFNPTAV
jgi:ankyrin repeat protein